MRSELSGHNKDLEYLPCTSRNNTPEVVWVVAARRAQGSRLRGRGFSPRAPRGIPLQEAAGMGQEGVLARKSCQSWVSWACWGGTRPVWRHATPSAGSLGCRKLARDGVLGVTGPWEEDAALGGISAVLDCVGGADCESASVSVAASRRCCNPSWRPRP